MVKILPCISGTPVVKDLKMKIFNNNLILLFSFSLRL
jgi:hypothetical protein